MPPNGTAGLARTCVRGISRLPSPPARTIARTRGAVMARTIESVLDLHHRYGRLDPHIDTEPPGSGSVARGMECSMRVDLLTREYPPHVYGGAGVHVAELSAVLAPQIEVQVRCFDGPRADTPDTPGTPTVTGYQVPEYLHDANSALATFGVDLAMTADVAGADLVHSHTWYTNLAGHMAGLLHDVPHVLSAHSLEPLRPWKAEQLGGGYALSSWAERSAYEGA